MKKLCKTEIKQEIIIRFESLQFTETMILIFNSSRNHQARIIILQVKCVANLHAKFENIKNISQNFQLIKC